jgi:hypothetical protein
VQFRVCAINQVGVAHQEYSEMIGVSWRLLTGGTPKSLHAI